MQTLQLKLPPAPWWRQRWPWLLMLGPFVVLVAGVYTGWLAFSQQDALVVGDYYKQGKAINQDLRRDKAASALGLSAVLRYDPSRGMLSGTLDSASNAVPRRVTLHLAHATQPAKDIRLALAPGADGAFSAILPLLERSRWQVLLESERRDWRLAGSWNWPAQREVAVRAD